MEINSSLGFNYLKFEVTGKRISICSDNGFKLLDSNSLIQSAPTKPSCSERIIFGESVAKTLLFVYVSQKKPLEPYYLKVCSIETNEVLVEQQVPYNIIGIKVNAEFILLIFPDHLKLLNLKNLQPVINFRIKLPCFSNKTVSLSINNFDAAESSNDLKSCLAFPLQNVNGVMMMLCLNKKILELYASVASQVSDESKHIQVSALSSRCSETHWPSLQSDIGSDSIDVQSSSKSSSNPEVSIATDFSYLHDQSTIPEYYLSADSPPLLSAIAESQWIFSAADHPIACVSFSGDASLLATASVRGTVIRVWDVKHRRHLYNFQRSETGRISSIYSLSFSIDNNLLACSGSTDTIHIFALDDSLKGMQTHLSFIQNIPDFAKEQISKFAPSFVTSSHASSSTTPSSTPPPPFKLSVIKIKVSSLLGASLLLQSTLGWSASPTPENYNLLIAFSDGSFFQCAISHDYKLLSSTKIVLPSTKKQLDKKHAK